jgi:hypothetical protein
MTSRRLPPPPPHGIDTHYGTPGYRVNTVLISWVLVRLFYPLPPGLRCAPNEPNPVDVPDGRHQRCLRPRAVKQPRRSDGFMRCCVHPKLTRLHSTVGGLVCPVAEYARLGEAVTHLSPLSPPPTLIIGTLSWPGCFGSRGGKRCRVAESAIKVGET